MSYIYNINHIVPKDLIPSDGSNINLNSPRFREACQIQEIEIEELLPKNQNEIREMYKQEQFNREALILATQHYEARREAKIRIILSERQRIIEEDLKKQRKHPEKFKPDRLFTLTGKVAKGPMLPETLEERRKLREMIVNQQKEIDEALIRAEYECPRAKNLHRERLLQQRAEEAHNNASISAGGIEVINGDEYRKETRKDCNGDIPNIKKLRKSSFYLKPWRKATRLNGKERRYHQRLVYHNEILRFMEDEKRPKAKEKSQKPNYLYFLRRQEGSYLEFDYVWRQSKKTHNIQETRAIKNFYENALKLEEDEQIRAERRQRVENLSLTKYAQNQSKKVLDSKKKIQENSPIKRSAGGKSYEARILKRLDLSFDDEDGYGNRFFNLDIDMDEKAGKNGKRLDSVHCYNAAESSEEEWEDTFKENYGESEDEIAPDNKRYAKGNDPYKSDGFSMGDQERPLRSGISSMRTTGATLNPNRMISSNGLKYLFAEKVNSQTSNEEPKNQTVSFGKENNQEEYKKLAKIGLRMSEDDDLYQTIRRDMFNDYDSLQHWKQGQDKKNLKKLSNNGELKAKINYV